jgi:hypothetical protein
VTILTKRESWKRTKGPGRYTPDLTPEEIANAKRALGVMLRRFGTWHAAAEALGAKLATVKAAVDARKGKPSVGLALRVARVVGVPLEDILAGTWPKDGACTMCGRTG